jgi:hypothetical protein
VEKVREAYEKRLEGSQLTEEEKEQKIEKAIKRAIERMEKS